MARPADVIVQHHPWPAPETRAVQNEPTRLNGFQPDAPPTSRVSLPQLVKAASAAPQINVCICIMVPKKEHHPSTWECKEREYNPGNYLVQVLLQMVSASSSGGNIKTNTTIGRATMRICRMLACEAKHH